MDGIPVDATPDATLALLREGCGFVSRRTERLRSDVFWTRIMLTPVLCGRGEAAAETFYATDRFTRRGAMPTVTVRLLQDKGSVQQLDGAAHRHRKAMFMGLLTDEARVARLGDAVTEGLRAARSDWQARGRFDLVTELGRVLTEAGGRWMGLPPDDCTPEVAGDLLAMIEGAGGFGPSMVAALARRRRYERRIRGFVTRVRAGETTLPADAPARVIAEHRDAAGRPLDVSDAVVEIINITRPVVAVAHFAALALLALARHPDWRGRLAADDGLLEPFAEEVRRHYPFFPLIGGRARGAFEFRGQTIREGTWMLLDLYGTDHDPALHPEPFAFSPGRDLSWRAQSCRFIPQGGGRAEETHRCPGEWATVEIMKRVLAFFTREVGFELEAPEELALNRFPTLRTGDVSVRVA